MSKRTMDGSGPMVVTRWPFVFSKGKPATQPAQMGTIRVLDLNDSRGARLDPGFGVLYGADKGLDAVRVVTSADEARILAAQAAVAEALVAASRVYAAAFRRGRKPTLDEVRKAGADD